MYLTEQLESKWGEVLDFDGLKPIKDPFRRAVTAILLENTASAIAEESSNLTNLLQLTQLVHPSLDTILF